MDDQRAREAGPPGRREAAFLVNAAARGAVPRLEVVGTTEAFRDPGLARAVSAQSGSTEAQLAQGDLPSPFELSVGGRDYLATLVPILSGSGEPVGGLVVGRSKDVELAALREIRRSLLGVGALILVLCVPLSFAFSRVLARPIHQLPRARRRSGAGTWTCRSRPRAGARWERSRARSR